MATEQRTNIIDFPATYSLGKNNEISLKAPESTRPLTDKELRALDVFDKALVALIFTARNLDSRKITIKKAESDMAKIVAILAKRFHGC